MVPTGIPAIWHPRHLALPPGTTAWHHRHLASPPTGTTAIWHHRQLASLPFWHYRHLALLPVTTAIPNTEIINFLAPPPNIITSNSVAKIVNYMTEFISFNPFNLLIVFKTLNRVQIRRYYTFWHHRQTLLRNIRSPYLRI